MTNPEKLRVGVVGVNGLGSLQLVQLVMRCPNLHLSVIADPVYAGNLYSQLYPRFWNTLDLHVEPVDIGALVNSCDVVFLALPEGEATRWVPELLDKGGTAIDLSADYRLWNLEDYRTWYGALIPDEGQWPTLRHQQTNQQAVYGLPELYREHLQSARLIAIPGCHATASVLAIAPLLRQGFIDPERISIDAKVGMSATENFVADRYGPWVAVENTLRVDSILQHRQIPEIEQVYSQLAGQPIVVQFASYLVPMVRGLLTTVYVTLRDPGLENDDLLTIYRAYYKQSPWVQILPSGTFPQTKWTAGTNRCSIGLTLDTRTNQLVVVCAIDNSIKGQAGQAIQCLNVMQGWPETLGLPQSSLYL
ncbi:MAG: N-acetyl-gamma-glutamyl-phosphate reductase [Cyanobacteria bacterium P01_E01_bin.34]